MTVWRAFVWHFLWCCATIVLLVLSQAIYPWIWIWEMRRGSLPSMSVSCPWMSNAIGMAPSVDASTVRTGLREMGEVEGEVEPMT